MGNIMVLHKEIIKIVDSEILLPYILIIIIKDKIKSKNKMTKRSMRLQTGSQRTGCIV